MKGKYRFKKQERIASSRDFKKVMKLGKKIQSKNFTLFILQNDYNFHRLGIIIKKGVGKATYRNRVKRLIREFFRLNKHLIKNHFDLIFLIKKGCTIKNYQDVEQEVKELKIFE